MLIRGSRYQYLFDGFTGLIAVFHALHRLPAPRHPPHALSSLAALILSSAPELAGPIEDCIPLLAPGLPATGFEVTILFSSSRAHAETRKKLNDSRFRTPRPDTAAVQLL